MQESSKNHRFVFICGLHRSGTSLLNRLLASHPEISAFDNTGATDDEGQFLQSVYPRSRNLSEPGRFCFLPDTAMTESSRLVTTANQTKLFASWSKYWDLNKPVLLEESSPNIVRSRFLQAMFPESYFLFLVRHPIPVSFATQKINNSDLPSLFEHWHLAHQTALIDRRKLKHQLLIRYEDLTSTPDLCLKQIGEFLKIAPFPIAEDVNEDINKEFFRSWEQYRQGNKDAAQAAVKFSETPLKFGYSFDPPYTHQLPQTLAG